MAASAAIGLLLAAAGPAGASFPGSAGKFLYTANAQLFDYDSTQGAHFLAAGFSGRYSADGTKIAFFSNAAGIGHCELYVMDADGTNVIQLTHGGTNCDYTNPTWSPDGTKLAFVRLEGLFSAATSIKTINADGSNEQVLVPGDSVAFNGTPVWSPDGSKLAFTHQPFAYGLDSDVYVINADGSGETNLTCCSEVGQPRLYANPDWAPDGTQLVFSNGLNFPGSPPPGIYLVNADGTNLHVIPTTFGAGNPIWSPDGAMIAYTYYDYSTSQADIFVIDPDGTNSQDVTNTSGIDESLRDWQPLPLPADANGDGIVDSLQPPGTPSGSFADGGTTAGTFGAIPAGYTVTVTDLPDPAGVHVVVSGVGSDPVTIALSNPVSPGTPCGTVQLLPGSDVELTCGSITVHVVAGSAQVVLAGGATIVSVPAGVTAKVTDTGGGGFTVENQSGSGNVTVTTGGASTTIAPGQTGSIDTSPPVITPTVTGTLGTNGWYRSSVSVTWSVVDTQSAVSSTTGCGPSTVSADTTGVTKTCEATSGGGTGSQSVVIKKDATLPNVSFASHPSIYTVDQTVAIGCTASDATSGLQTSCQPINAAAYTFPLGSNSRSTSATDKAGNTRSVSTSFTVRVTATSLCNLTRQLVHASAKYQTATPNQRAGADLVVSASCVALNARQTGIYKAAVTVLASTGWLTTAQANTLRSLADRL